MLTHHIHCTNKTTQHNIDYIKKCMENLKRKSILRRKKTKQQAKKQTNLIKSNINLSYLTFGNLTPMIASSGFDRKQFVISFVTSLFNRLFPFVSKWHAIC